MEGGDGERVTRRRMKEGARRAAVKGERTPPKFTRTPEDQTGVQGGVSSFVCQAAGDPQPKIVWNRKAKSQQPEI
ncbi:hypothetical protein F7725_005532 [Dissostichus mawsoni]|uniref:Ig-like domain-containing protein n=1 Tax=Dissostichus mawsoni TaxID=36200 RepID=A0A7J5YUK7_DISMA|nr:hypothetical protein F7725_005532 [Dissostichus mawsoni]